MDGVAGVLVETLAVEAFGGQLLNQDVKLHATIARLGERTKHLAHWAFVQPRLHASNQVPPPLGICFRQPGQGSPRLSGATFPLMARVSAAVLVSEFRKDAEDVLIVSLRHLFGTHWVDDLAHS